MKFLSGIVLSIGLPAVIAIQAMANDSDVSGIFTGRHETITVSAPGFGLVGIKSAKRDSSPCRMELRERPVASESTATEKLTLNKCHTKKSRDAKSAQFDDPGVFVRGLSVCLTSELRHLRPDWAGTKLFGAKVSKTDVRPLDDGREVGFERRRCAEWQEPVFCADGEIATGVTAYLRKARVDDTQIVGLSLVCEMP